MEEHMKLTIFGGSGRTGQLLVRKALDAGHEVTVLARTPGKIAFSHPQLRVLPGDINDAAAVAGAVVGADVVINLVSGAAAARNVVAAMQASGPRRLLSTIGAGVGDPADKPGAADKIISGLIKTLARKTWDDALAQAEAVRGSGLDWTLVRVGRLTDGPAAGARAGYLGRAGNSLTRADLADWLLAQLTDDAYVGKAPVVSN
jgi:putative NADH-flavin reductase